MGRKESVRICSDYPELGPVTFRKSLRARRVIIRVHPVKGVSVAVPFMVPYAAALAFFKLKRDWVVRTVARQKEAAKDVPEADPVQIEEMRRQAKEVLPLRLEELAVRYGFVFVYNKVTIKHNSTNWGSCSARNNINLNLNLMRLPSLLRDYVILHELCHLRHHDHGQAFHLLLEHLCTDHVLRLMQDGDKDASEMARLAALSKVRYPFDHIFSKQIKHYRLV